MDDQTPSFRNLSFEPRPYIVRCCHKMKHGIQSQVFSVGFWLGMTIGFPFEHFLYEKVWPFTWLAKLLGLH